MNALQSLTVKGFRGFRDLEIERLGRVNLIVGKNNVGKSSLLEALRLYTSKGAEDVIQSLLLSREELATHLMRSKSDPAFEVRRDELFSMLHLHHDPTLMPAPIEIGPFSLEPTLTIQLRWYRTEIDEHDNMYVAFWPGSTAEDPFESYRPVWSIKFGLGRERTVYLDELSRRIPVQRHAPSNAIEYIPSNGLTSIQLGRLFDHLVVADQVHDVLLALRLIAPDVEQVFLVGESVTRRVLVRIRGKSEPVPLKSMGDGMIRILGIILALVNAKGGMLLVDEIENGIHYTVMPALWHLVLRVAAELNVQVFATSHSWDCLEGFQNAACTDQQNQGMLIRLERRKGEIQAVLFDEEELAIVTRERIEVR